MLSSASIWIGLTGEAEARLGLGLALRFFSPAKGDGERNVVMSYVAEVRRCFSILESLIRAKQTKSLAYNRLQEEIMRLVEDPPIDCFPVFASHSGQTYVSANPSVHFDSHTI